MKNHYKGYVKSEIKQAERLFFLNMTYKQIGERLGRTEAAVKDLFKRMGLRRYKSPSNANYSKAG